MEQKKITARCKGIIEADGLQFKDLDGTGELKPYEDWRLSPEERAREQDPVEGRLPTLEELGDRYVAWMLRHTGGKVAGAGGAAELLGVHPNTVRERSRRECRRCGCP